jgi:hypothetical protein
MVKICPNCGFQVVDDYAIFCNKCGSPFPRVSPGRVTVARPAASRPAPHTARRPVRKKTGIKGYFSFDTLIFKKYIWLIYIVGAILIILFSINGITGGYARKGAVPANMSFTNISAVVQNPDSSPLYWILFLIVGSVLWRVICELCVVLYRPDDGGGGEDEPFLDEETEEFGDEEYGEEEVATEQVAPAGPTEYVECPHCMHIVPVDQLRECEKCGVQGCTNCIRLSGLMKKKFTCRECYEGK